MYIVIFLVLRWELRVPCMMRNLFYRRWYWHIGIRYSITRKLKDVYFDHGTHHEKMLKQPWNSEQNAFKELLNAIESSLQALLGGYSNGKFSYISGGRGNSQSKWFLSGVGQPLFWPPPCWKSSKNKHSLHFPWRTNVRKAFSKGK